MKLLFAVFRWIFSRLLLLTLIAALVVLVAIAHDWWQERKVREVQLQQLQQELGDLNQKIRKLQSDLSLENRYLRLKQNEPSMWRSPIEWYRWDKEVEMLGGLIDKKNAELNRLRRQQAALVQRAQESSEALYRTQELITSTLRKSIKTILILFAIIFFGPFLWRAFWYFVIAGLAQHASAIRLNRSEEQAGTGLPLPETDLTVQPSRKNQPVQLQSGETLLTRMAWLHQYTPSARKRTKFLMDWRSPFISYAAGLAELTEVKVPPQVDRTEVVLTSAEDPDTFVCEIQLKNHPGFVVYPSQVIAITGNLRLRTEWTLMNLHSWIAGRLRHIIFSGTGRIYVKGTGGLEAICLHDQPVRLSESIVSGFESDLSFSTIRTETFWPYYRRHATLFDYEFDGNGILLRQTVPDAKRMESGTIRILDAFLNGIGKLLGL
jgi:hypothetical protein